MLIILKKNYKVENNTFDPATIQFCHETFDSNLDNFRKFFTQDFDIDEIKVDTYVLNEFNKTTDDTDAVRLMMKDVKDEKSCTYRIIAPLFNQTNIIDKKIEMLRALLENYFVARALNLQNDYKQCVYDYLGPYNFKFYIPKTLSEKYNEERILKLSEVEPKDLLTYVIPFYYNEIGWWDRKRLREDAEVMEKLSSSWADKCIFF